MMGVDSRTKAREFSKAVAVVLLQDHLKDLQDLKDYDLPPQRDPFDLGERLGKKAGKISLGMESGIDRYFDTMDF